jgi:hypothetical protein
MVSKVKNGKVQVLIKLSPEVKNKLNSIGETYQESIEDQWESLQPLDISHKDRGHIPHIQGKRS